MAIMVMKAPHAENGFGKVIGSQIMYLNTIGIQCNRHDKRINVI